MHYTSVRSFCHPAPDATFFCLNSRPSTGPTGWSRCTTASRGGGSSPPSPSRSTRQAPTTTPSSWRTTSRCVHAATIDDWSSPRSLPCCDWSFIIIGLVLEVKQLCFFPCRDWCGPTNSSKAAFALLGFVQPSQGIRCLPCCYWSSNCDWSRPLNSRNCVPCWDWSWQ